MQYSQGELVQRLRNKDSTAYEYMKTIYSLAYNILSGSHSKEDIEECVADVFLDAWVKISEFDEEKANFRTWLLILMAAYEKSVANVRINIPTDGETILHHEVDLLAQKAIIENIKRLSPTSAELTFQLNTGVDQYVSINRFSMFSDDIKKISAEFSGDQAIVTLEFNEDVVAFDLDISWPIFVVNGNWTINTK